MKNPRCFSCILWLPRRPALTRFTESAVNTMVLDRIACRAKKIRNARFPRAVSICGGRRTLAHPRRSGKSRELVKNAEGARELGSQKPKKPTVFLNLFQFCTVIQTWRCAQNAVNLIASQRKCTVRCDPRGEKIRNPQCSSLYFKF